MAKSFWDLRRSNRDCIIAGICGGLGEYTPMPAWMWRALFIFSLFIGGAGIVAYIILWICMPVDEYF
ncbi:MAG: PspC domain-containing protein [Victivallales bacterium]|nr:PspC domain-containing protein [Victivallales bacterium]